MGNAVGIRLFSDGILVVGTDESSPAAACLKTGDFILTVNGASLSSTEDFQARLQACGTNAVSLGIRRNGHRRTVSLCPVAENGVLRIGAYVRDSMAGIGTLTFVDPESGDFAALGHSINDVDTGLLLPLESGGLMTATVSAVQKGGRGSPGQLKGCFDQSRDIGVLRQNDECGIFGTMTDFRLSADEALPVAAKGEVREGAAEILCEVGDDGVQRYAVEISKIYALSGKTRNMLITVTDPALLARTGGIVQGMSGSPILQDGKIVGAVTHVLLEEPKRGYAIFAENMLAASGEKKKAA